MSDYNYNFYVKTKCNFYCNCRPKHNQWYKIKKDAYPLNKFGIFPVSPMYPYCTINSF